MKEIQEDGATVGAGTGRRSGCAGFYSPPHADIASQAPSLGLGSPPPPPHYPRTAGHRRRHGPPSPGRAGPPRPAPPQGGPPPLRHCPLAAAPRRRAGLGFSSPGAGIPAEPPLRLPFPPGCCEADARSPYTPTHTPPLLHPLARRSCTGAASGSPPATQNLGIAGYRQYCYKHPPPSPGLLRKPKAAPHDSSLPQPGQGLEREDRLCVGE